MMHVLVLGVALSRWGLWTLDLAVSQMLQVASIVGPFTHCLRSWSSCVSAFYSVCSWHTPDFRRPAMPRVYSQEHVADGDLSE
jgi:Ferroportin1 (FPN1)